jgi:hypothetical protein
MSLGNKTYKNAYSQYLGVKSQNINHSLGVKSYIKNNGPGLNSVGKPQDIYQHYSNSEHVARQPMKSTAFQHNPPNSNHIGHSLIEKKKSTRDTLSKFT